MDLKEIQDIIKNVMRRNGPREIAHCFFPGFGDAMAKRGFNWAQTLTNGAIDEFMGQTMLPNDFVVGTVPTIQAVLIIGNDTGNIRSDTGIHYAKLGENYTSNGSSNSDSVDAVGTANAIWYSDALAFVAGVANGDHISSWFRRESDSAQDTVEVDCYGIGFVLNYERYV